MVRGLCVIRPAYEPSESKSMAMEWKHQKGDMQEMIFKHAQFVRVVLEGGILNDALLKARDIVW